MEDGQHEVTFRPATLDDYEGVLAVSGPNHYEGYDYLPDLYETFVKSPFRRCFVGEIGSKIVFFNIVSMVDDGETGVVQAIRTHPDYRNMGIASKGKRHNFSAAKREFPSMVRMRNTGLYRVYESLCQKDPSIEILGQRARCAVLVPNDDLARVTSPAFLTQLGLPLTSSVQLTGEQLLKELTNEDLELLAPDGQFVLAFLPVRPLVSNVELIVNDHDPVIVVTKSRESIVALSFGVPQKVACGIKYDLQFFGYDEGILRDHVIQHLLIYNRKLAQFGNGEVSLWVRFPVSDHFNVETISTFLVSRLSLKPTSDSLASTNIALIEMPLPI